MRFLAPCVRNLICELDCLGVRSLCSLSARTSVRLCMWCVFCGALCVYVFGGWVGGGWACVSCQRLVQVQKTEFDAIYHAFFDPTRLYSDGIRLKVFIT